MPLNDFNIGDLQRAAPRSNAQRPIGVAASYT
jgi:hypothetical protein